MVASQGCDLKPVVRAVRVRREGSVVWVSELQAAKLIFQSRTDWGQPCMQVGAEPD